EFGISQDNALNFLSVELPAALTQGKMRGNTFKEIEITQSARQQKIDITRDDMATRFVPQQKVRVTAGGGPPQFGVVDAVQANTKKITLADPLPNTFTDNTDVEVVIVVDGPDVPESIADLRTVTGTVLAPGAGGAVTEVEIPNLVVFTEGEAVRLLKVG